jgi:outer membrane protein OmpA-like peptidoglycan-associated protein
MRAKRIVGIVAALLVRALPAAAEPYPFLGLNLGVAQPTNDNYNAHCHTGLGTTLYGGQMFTENFGVRADLQTTFNPPDDDGRGIPDEEDWSTLLGVTVGPRLALPLGPLFELHADGGVGGFAGLSGRLTQTDWGWSFGAGLDYYVAPRWAISAYGRWNGAAIAPVPHYLPPRVNSGRPQNPEDQGPADIRWVNAGIGLRYDFRKPAAIAAAPLAEPYMPQPAPAYPPATLPPPPPTDVRLPPPPRRIVLHNVEFEFDQATITPESYRIIDEAAGTLRDLGWPDVVVEGHTDSRGSDSHNLRLSQRRADAVVRYLVGRGAPASTLRAVGYGESRPIAGNDTDAGRARNRRVELHIRSRPD